MDLAIGKHRSFVEKIRCHQRRFVDEENIQKHQQELEHWCLKRKVPELTVDRKRQKSSKDTRSHSVPCSPRQAAPAMVELTQLYLIGGAIVPWPSVRKPTVELGTSRIETENLRVDANICIILDWLTKISARDIHSEANL